MARSAGVKAIAKEEKRMEKERKRRIEHANKMLIPVSKKTMETLGLISFDPNGVFRLTDNRWMRVFVVEGEPKALASIAAKLSGRIRIVWHFREDGGRATCHLVLMETGEIYEEVRQLMSKDEELLKEAVRMTPLSVDEVMNQIGEKFGQSIRFSYASHVRGNPVCHPDCNGYLRDAFVLHHYEAYGNADRNVGGGSDARDDNEEKAGIHHREYACHAIGIDCSLCIPGCDFWSFFRNQR